jgi:hypothetical protein
VWVGLLAAQESFGIAKLQLVDTLSTIGSPALGSHSIMCHQAVAGGRV